MRSPVPDDQPGIYFFYENGTTEYLPTVPWRGNNYLFFCPNTGRVWAKAVSGDWTKGFHSVSRSLTRDTYWGPHWSVYLPTDSAFFHAFSKELLIREFELALAEPNHIDL